MPLNLITDQWLPVRLDDGSRRVIAPTEMADPAIAAPDWPRADLNLACYEFLIGLVFMACPPKHLDDWSDNVPDAATLAERLAPFAPAFNLLDDGPCFLQDFDELPGDPSSPDMLFIDSAGGNTTKNNADLMVHRDRYASLELPLAAMALYAFQQFAPAGGAGNRTSMRGGGPLTTLANPGNGLWGTVWANVPFGAPAQMSDLPWMRSTVTSEKGQTVGASQAHPVEAFFGMPRRLRLVGEENVTGVIQRPYGTNYGLWRHPLSPYRRYKVGEEPRARRPQSGRMPYRNWIGIVLAAQDDGLRHRAACIDGFFDRYDRPATGMIVAGWAMDNMKPRDFLWSELPLLRFDKTAQSRAEALIGAADSVAYGLRKALGLLAAEGSARDAEVERFWSATEGDFTSALTALSAENADWAAIASDFLRAIGRQALGQFEALALPGMADGRIERAGKIVTEHRMLRALVHGYGKSGQKLWAGLGLTPPDPKAAQTLEAAG